VITTVKAWKDMRETLHKVIELVPSVEEWAPHCRMAGIKKTKIGHKGKLNLMVELINLLQNSNLSPHWQRKIQHEFSDAMWWGDRWYGVGGAAGNSKTWADSRLSLLKNNSDRNGYGSGDILLLLAAYRNWNVGKDPANRVQDWCSRTKRAGDGFTWGDFFLNPSGWQGEQIDDREPHKWTINYNSDIHGDEIRDIFNPLRRWQVYGGGMERDFKFSDLANNHYNISTDQIITSRGRDFARHLAWLVYDGTCGVIKDYLRENKIKIPSKSKKADLLKLCFSF